MFKVSHEVPLFLLEDSKRFNHYDYALVHLLDKDEDYANYFKQAKQQGRYIILDNSLHELKTAYHDSGLLHWINELKPQEFIIPDVWQEASASIVNARKWSQIELPKEVTKVAVVQAKNFLEATICYQTYKDLGYKKIAFSYGAEYYLEHSNHPNKNLAKSLGRIEVVSRMYDMGLIKSNDRVHLLGCQVPQEFSWYKDMPFIETIDTSNPIMATIDGLSYSPTGLTEKPKANMNDHFYMSADEMDFDLLDHNINSFKKLLK
jgi:hypothetical protein